MQRRGIGAILIGGWLALGATGADAQEVLGPGKEPREVYGTSWGVASYGLIRTTSNYPSPWGAGYGYGTRPLGFVPGPWGMEMWNPGAVGSVGTYGVPGRYRTFPYPYPPGPPVYGPSIGEYAPGFGPTLRSATIR